MKFSKGLLDDIKAAPASPVERRQERALQRPARTADGRLFDTHNEVAGSSRHYLKFLAIFIVLVIAAIGGIAYFSMPKPGDEVRAPAGLEQALRDHLLDVDKRTATDITVYYCGDTYWARVGVEQRPDIKTNPLYQLDKYKAVASASQDGTWQVTSSPVTSPDVDVPCR